MAGLHRAQKIDQWRPEESSFRDRDRERPRKQLTDTRDPSPAPRGGRENTKRVQPDLDTHASAKRSRGRSRHRSQSRDRTLRRSRGDSREDWYRPSKGRAPSSDRVSHSHRHHHHRHHDTSPSSKRRRSRTPSPHRDSIKRTKRRRSRSTERSPSRARHPDSSHRALDRAYSPRPPRSDRERPARRPTPDFYKPSTAPRHRSRSADSHYRPALNRERKRSVTPDKRPRRNESSRRHSPKRHHKRRHTPSVEDRGRGHKPTSRKDVDRSHSPPPRYGRSKSPRHRPSPTPHVRRRSPHYSRREGESPRRGRSPRASTRRPSSSGSPHHKFRDTRESDKKYDAVKHTKVNKYSSGRTSPLPEPGYTSDTQKSVEGDAKMRGAYHHQGRPPRPGVDTHSNFSQSPPYMTPNQFSPQGQSPYHSARGGWGAQHHPYPNHQGSPMQSYSPNQSPYHQNYSPPGHQGQYYPNQSYPGPQHQMQQGYQNSSYRGGHGGGFRGNHFNGPDRRISGAGPSASYPPVQSQRGRSAAPTQYSNLSWTPSSGTRGGRPAAEAAPRNLINSAGTTPKAALDAQASSVDEEDNPFRPSKDLR
ncbi:hypothetical protein K469DRAFT_490543, partial [Zopfia rhizophila CBS 207.26]